MEIFWITFETIITLIGIGVLGFWVIAKRIYPVHILEVLSSLAIDIALPCLIFYNIITKFSPNTYPGWWQMPLWWIALTLGLAFLTYFFSFLAPKKLRREFSISLFYQNGIFIPVAILANLYGDTSSFLTDLFLFTMIFTPFFFNTYQFFFREKKKQDTKTAFNWKKTFNPVVIATLLALGIKLTGVERFVPVPLLSISHLLSRLTLPAIFLYIGGSIYVDSKAVEKFQIREMLIFILIKNILFPLCTLAVLFQLSVPFNIGLILLLESAVPPISAISIVTVRAGGNRSIVNQFFIASLLASIVTIPFVLWLFSTYIADLKL